MVRSLSQTLLRHRHWLTGFLPADKTWREGFYIEDAQLIVDVVGIAANVPDGNHCTGHGPKPTIAELASKIL